MNASKLELARSFGYQISTGNEVAISQLREVLHRHRGSRRGAAIELGVSRVTMIKWADLAKAPKRQHYDAVKATRPARVTKQRQVRAASQALWRRDPEAVERLRAAYTRHYGCTIRVAAELGVAVSTCTRWADMVGIPRRTHRDSAANFRKANPDVKPFVAPRSIFEK